MKKRLKAIQIYTATTSKAHNALKLTRYLMQSLIFYKMNVLHHTILQTGEVISRL